MDLVNFIVSENGRWTRAILGLTAIMLGLLVITSSVRYLFIGVGVVAVAAAWFDVCLIALLFGKPIAGSRLRQEDE